MAWCLCFESHRKDVGVTRDRYWELSKDDKLQDIKQGKLPEQVALEKAAYLMDAAMLGAEVRMDPYDRGWEMRLTDSTEVARPSGQVTVMVRS